MVSSITQDEFACYLNNSPYCFYRKCIREGSKGEITLPTDFSRYVNSSCCLLLLYLAGDCFYRGRRKLYRIPELDGLQPGWSCVNELNTKANKQLVPCSWECYFALQNFSCHLFASFPLRFRDTLVLRNCCMEPVK